MSARSLKMVVSGGNAAAGATQLRQSVAPGALTMPHHIRSSIQRRHVRSSFAMAAGRGHLSSTRQAIKRMEEELARLQASLDQAFSSEEADACSDCEPDQRPAMAINEGPSAGGQAGSGLEDKGPAGGGDVFPTDLKVVPEGVDPSVAGAAGEASGAPAAAAEAHADVPPEINDVTEGQVNGELAPMVPSQPSATAGESYPQDLQFDPEAVDPSAIKTAGETSDALASAAQSSPVMPPDLYYVPEGGINGELDPMVPSEASKSLGAAASGTSQGPQVQPPELYSVPEGNIEGSPDGFLQSQSIAAALDAAPKDSPVLPPDLYFVPEGTLQAVQVPGPDVGGQVTEEALHAAVANMEALLATSLQLDRIPDAEDQVSTEALHLAVGKMESLLAASRELDALPDAGGQVSKEALHAAVSQMESLLAASRELDRLPDAGGQVTEEALHAAVADMESLLATSLQPDHAPDVSSQASNEALHAAVSKMESLLAASRELDRLPDADGQVSKEALHAAVAKMESLLAATQELDHVPVVASQVTGEALSDSVAKMESMLAATLELDNTPVAVSQVSEEALHTAVAKLESLLATSLATGQSPGAGGQVSDEALNDAAAKMESLLAMLPEMDHSSYVANPAWASLISKLQSATSSLSTTKAASSPEQFQYALETLKKLQAELQNPAMVPYWAPGGVTGGQEVVPDAPLSSSEYWMPEGHLGGTPDGVEESLEALKDTVSRNGYWVPDGVEGIAVPQLPPTGLEGGQFPPELSGGVAAASSGSGSSTIQDAIKDLVDFMDLPPSDTSAVMKLVDEPPVPVQSVVPAESVDQVVTAVSTIKDVAESDSGVRAFLRSIHSLGEALAEQFQQMPMAGSVPILGRVLAYVLAGAGVVYLMKELIPTGQSKASLNPLPIEPIVLVGKEGKEAHRPTNTGVTATVPSESVIKPKQHGSPGANGTAKTLASTAKADDAASEEPASSLSSSGSVDEPVPVLPWMMDDPSGWGAQPEFAEPEEEVALNVHVPDSALAPVPHTSSSRAEPVAAVQRNAVAADSDEAATKDDERARDIDVLAERRRAAIEEISHERSLVKEKLWWVVRGLGHTAAIVPGGEEVRSDIDGLISALEKMTPLETPLNTQSNAEEFAYMKAKSKAHPNLLGEWRLEYASNEQVVEKNIMQQALQLAEAIPGFGVGDVMQQLQTDSETDNLITENTAVFGLGPFGSWQISVSGIWADNGGGVCAKASFKSFSVRPVKIMGLPADALPEVRVAVPSELQTEVEWCTTYCDKDFRVGRGTTGNLFVFRKDPNGSTARLGV